MFKAHSNQNTENKDSSQRHRAPGPWKQKLTYKQATDKYSWLSGERFKFEKTHKQAHTESKARTNMLLNYWLCELIQFAAI